MLFDRTNFKEIAENSYLEQNKIKFTLLLVFTNQNLYNGDK